MKKGKHVKTMIQKCNIFQLFPNAPALRPHGTPPKRCSSSWRCRSTKFHPDWTKRHPIHAHFSFQFLAFFQPSQQKTRLGTLGITWRRKGNLVFSFSICFLVGFDLKSISFPPPGHLSVLESSNRTKGWPPIHNRYV